MAEQLLDIADELYGLPVGEFTAARDARAKALKGTDLAAPVKALRKPSVAGWVVNQLVRRETEQVEQVLAVGAALREAQAAMSADELRTLTRQRRQLTAAVTTRARGVAADLGVRLTQAVADQVEATLTAAMVDEGCAKAVRSGLLLGALTATGVDEVDVAGAVALPDALGFAATAVSAEAPARPELRVVPDPDREAKARAAAQEALSDAESVLSAAESDLSTAAAAVADLEARSLQIQAEIEEQRSRLAELERAAEEVDDEFDEAEEARTEAESQVAVTVKARDEAAAALARLG